VKVSLQWAADYVTLPAAVTAEQIAYALTMATVEVEHVIDLAAPLAQVLVARITGVDRHPESDRLAVVACDAGAGRPVTVVSAGTNLRPGQLVALALPGATVRGRGGDGPIAVSERDLRGVHSSGMVCGAAELGLEQLFPPAGETDVLDLSDLEVEAGVGLAAAIGYDDVVLEIDNKSLTNRPDLLGHRGIARELSAIYACPFAPLARFSAPATAGGLAVSIEEPSRCRRYTATRIEGIRVTPSPFWLRSRLARVGQRPINLPVDLTNYVMLALGQPSHAFDTAQLNGAIHVRLARPGEEMELLDGKMVIPGETTLVIADERRAVALAGVMGGIHSSIADDTGEMLLEIANFEAGGVRRAGARLGVRTESSMRFEKALDPALIDDALALFFTTLTRAQPAARATAFVDCYPAPIKPLAIVTSVEFINRRLGAELPPAEMRLLLERLGFGVSADGGRLSVEVPSWRATGDVSLPEDLVEEVGRLYGYENLKFVAPMVKLERAIRQPQLSLERRIRSYLAGPGAMQEIVSYPWVEDRYLKAAGIAAALDLATPPTPETGGLQSSLVPQMLAAVASNLRFFPGFRLFEVARVFPSASLEQLHPGSEMLPRQPKHLAGALVGTGAAALFLEAKGILEALGREAQMEPLGFAGDGPQAPWAEPGGQVALTAGERVVGQVGVVSAKAARLSGIRRASVALFALDLTLLRPNPSRQNHFEAIPTHPQKDYDLSLLVPVEVRWADLHRTLSAAHELVREVRLVEEYRGEQVPKHRKSLLVEVRMGAADHTLRAQEVDEAAAALVRRVEQEFNAELRGKTAS
jgi:phenylalanyl-tRNA synthetase beta chain